MTIAELLTLIKRYLALIIIVPVVLVAVATWYCRTRMVDEYTASCSLYVLVSDDASSNEEQYSSLSYSFDISQQIAYDVSQLIMSDRVLARAVEQLDEGLRNPFSISVGSGEESRMLRVMVTSTDPQEAAHLANAIAGVVSDIAQEAMNVQGINVIDEARVPLAPSGPNRGRYIFAAGAVGLFGTMLLIIIGYGFDTRVRRVNIGECTQLPLMGIMPFSPVGGRARRRMRKGVPACIEAARRLSANVKLWRADDSSRVIMVTSPAERASQAVAAGLLARSFVEQGECVVLVDFDSESGLLSGLAEPDASFALDGVMNGDVVPADVLRGLGDSGLCYLSRGNGDPEAPARFSRGDLERLFDSFDTRTVRVVVNASPMCLYSDAARIAPLVDAALLVVQAGATKRGDLKAAAAQLALSSVPSAIVLCDGARRAPRHRSVRRRSAADAVVRDVLSGR